MNIWITAEPTTTARDAHAIRQRLMNPPAAKKVAQTPEVLPVRDTDKTVRPTLDDTEGLHNRHGLPSQKERPYRPGADHTVAELRARGLDIDDPRLLVTDFLKIRCSQMNISFRQVMTESRTDDLAQPRHRLIAEVHARYPQFSKSHIGRIFGRDRTVVLHAIRKMAGEGIKQ